jgi:hypothetical protein
VGLKQGLMRHCKIGSSDFGGVKIGYSFLRSKFKKVKSLANFESEQIFNKNKPQSPQF